VVHEVRVEELVDRLWPPVLEDGEQLTCDLLGLVGFGISNDLLVGL
jgi:hypothetical protein